jgi:prepilin-type N-terminal cleavage/methylation domain-containing protein
VSEKGFTLIELMVAMAVFSFMLIIVVSGFISVVRMRNEALAADAAQDNARVAMDTLVAAVRDSSGVITPTAGLTGSDLCLDETGSTQRRFWVKTVSGVKVLYQNQDCSSSNGNAVTNPSIDVNDFEATNTSTIASNLKSEVELKVSVGTAGNNTVNAAGTACNNNNQDREFCSVITLTSGAVSR